MASMQTVTYGTTRPQHPRTNRTTCNSIGRPRAVLVRKQQSHTVVRAAPSARRFRLRVRASETDEASTSAEPAEPNTEVKAEGSKGLGKGVNLFDPAATLSRMITRRFGIVGGLAFVALLASTEGFEIVRALLEKETDGSGEVIELPSGLSYRDIKVGGGGSPKVGDFVGANFVVKEGERVVFDTKETGRPIAFTFGRRPYTSVVCKGVEEGVGTMRRGGKRELTVPPELAFGEEGRTLPNGQRIAPGATLTYIVSLEEVSGGYL